MDNRKGAQGASDGINEKQSYGKDSNDLHLPINYINLLRFDLNNLPLKELLFFHALIVKSSSFGSGFFFSIADAKEEMKIDRNFYDRTMKKFEDLGIVSREKVKANKQKINVNFDVLLSDEILIQFVVFDAKRDNITWLKDTISKHADTCLKRDMAKKKSLSDVEKLIDAKALRDMEQKINEIFKEARAKHLQKGEKLPPTTALSFTAGHREKLKMALKIHGFDVIRNAALAMFDNFFETKAPIISPVGMLLTTDSNGNFKKITYWNDQHATQWNIS